MKLEDFEKVLLEESKSLNLDFSKEQIKNLMDQKFTKKLNVRIMADCHAGTGCVIGTTMNINDCVVPNLVGVDIGCGMLTVKLGKMDIDLIKLDRFVRKKIPSGLETYSEEQPMKTNIEALRCYEHLAHKSRHKKSMGTLGGGNHFIEIDKDDEDNLYLVIHSGSRNLGKQVCEYYTKVAKEEYLKNKEKNYKALIKRYKKLNKEHKIEEGLNKLKEKYNSINFDLVPLEGKAFNDYMFDMDISQKFAYENRERMAYKILEFLELNLSDFEYFHTIHNYINMEDRILRKGSISAYEGEEVLIPFKEKIGQTTYSNIEKEGKEFTIGGVEDECGFIVLSIDSITLKGLYDRVAVSLTGVKDSTVNGTIIAATYDPRYSE